MQRGERCRSGTTMERNVIGVVWPRWRRLAQKASNRGFESVLAGFCCCLWAIGCGNGSAASGVESGASGVAVSGETRSGSSANIGPVRSGGASGGSVSGTSSSPTGGPLAGVVSSGNASGTAASESLGRCPDGFVFVPGGTFQMGSTSDDKDAEPDEKPQMEVTLRPYCLGRTEVTVDQYTRCVNGPGNVGGKPPSPVPSNGDAPPLSAVSTCSPASNVVVSFGLKPVDVLFWSKFCNAGRKEVGSHPINCVDFQQAETYCTWAGGRLPTEAEWEFAARGKEGRKYPWGNEPPGAELLNACGAECAANGPELGRRDKKSMFSGDDGAKSTASVGSYPKGASPFGALDMAGNVWEWTSDEYAPYGSKAKAKPPAGAPKPKMRAVRGGHWLNGGVGSPRGANREQRSEEKRLEDMGFRCAAEPKP